MKKFLLALVLALSLGAPAFAQITRQGLGDHNPSDPLQCYFNSYRYDTGAPTAMAGSPAVKVYKDGDATSEVTTGLTLNASFDSITGLNEVDVVTTNAFYAAGHSYTIVITSGTVNAVSVVGIPVCQFTLGYEALTAGGTVKPTLSLDHVVVLPASGDTDAVSLTGLGAGSGLKAEGGVTGIGINALGGATSGTAFQAAAQAGNSKGIYATGSGSGNGMGINAGATAIGLFVTGGLTSGNAVNFTAVNGNSDAFKLTPTGTGFAINATTNGTSGLLTPTKNVAITAFPFVMYSTSGSPLAGLTVTCTVSKDGGAFASCTNSASGISSGAYKINLASGDMNADTVILRFTASGARDTVIPIVTQP